MKFLSVLLLLGGYILVYASVARSGRFAAEPWQGLFQDAYVDSAVAEPQTFAQQQGRTAGARGGFVKGMTQMGGGG